MGEKEIGLFVSFTINNGCSIFHDNPTAKSLVADDRLIKSLDRASDVAPFIAGVKKTIEKAGFKTIISFSTYPRGMIFDEGEKLAKELQLPPKSILLIGSNGGISYNNNLLFQSNKLASGGEMVLFLLGIQCVCKEVIVEFDDNITGTMYIAGTEAAKKLLDKLSP